MGLKRLIIYAFLSSIIVVGKVVLALLPLPNIEIVTFLLIIYTLALGFKPALVISLVYTFVEFVIWGLGIQLYIWPLIVLVTGVVKYILKDNFILWSLYSGFFGLIFGLLCSLPKLLIDYSAFLSYFFAGIPFDVIHMIGNYVIMLLIGEIVYNRLKSLLS